MVIVGTKQTASAHNASLVFMKGSFLPWRLPEMYSGALQKPDSFIQDFRSSIH
jgi:hypothetical protein